MLFNVNLAVHVIQLYSMTRTINFVKMDDAGVDGVGQNCIPMGHQQLFLEISISLTAAVSG